MVRKRFDGSWMIFCLLLGLFMLAVQYPRSWERIARAHALEISPASPAPPRIADTPISTQSTSVAASDEVASPSAGPSLATLPQAKTAADEPAVSTPAPAMVPQRKVVPSAKATAAAPAVKKSAKPAATVSSQATVPARAQQAATTERRLCPRRRLRAFPGCRWWTIRPRFRTCRA